VAGEKIMGDNKIPNKSDLFAFEIRMDEYSSKAV
jgi:hypothetical protein